MTVVTGGVGGLLIASIGIGSFTTTTADMYSHPGNYTMQDVANISAQTAGGIFAGVGSGFVPGTNASVSGVRTYSTDLPQSAEGSWSLQTQPLQQQMQAAGATPSLAALSRAAAVSDRGGLTAAGRSLTKHGAGARPGNIRFPAARGSPATINQNAQNLVDDILTMPGSTIQYSFRPRFGSTIEVTAPNGQGLVFDATGKFLFFTE